VFVGPEEITKGRVVEELWVGTKHLWKGESAQANGALGASKMRRFRLFLMKRFFRSKRMYVNADFLSHILRMYVSPLLPRSSSPLSNAYLILTLITDHLRCCKEEAVNRGLQSSPEI
jgi:hypothetical protein